MKKITLSFDVLAAIIAVTILQACATIRRALTAVREADTDSPKRQRCAGECRPGHDKDDDDGGLFVLHARRF